MDTTDTAKRRIRPGLLLGVLLIGPFMAQADATIVNVAVPSVHVGLGASGAVLQLVIGGYLIAVSMLLITGARLGQAYGYRRAFVAGVSVFTLASLACGLAPDPAVLVVARILQGAGAGVMFPQTMTGIQLHFTGTDRVRAIGRYALALSSGAVSGQILGGVLVSADVAGLGWRAVFLVNVPVGVAAVAAALRFLPADGRREARLDLAGAGLLSVSALLLVVPLTLGSSGEALLAALLGLGGLGLGIEFAAQAGRLTAAVEPRYAADISGASSTLIQIGGAIGVAAVGALYLAGTSGAGSHAIGSAAAAAHAFAVTMCVLTGVALLAAAAAWRANAPAPSPITRAERAPVASFGPRSRVGS